MPIRDKIHTEKDVTLYGFKAATTSEVSPGYQDAQKSSFVPCFFPVVVQWMHYV